MVFTVFISGLGWFSTALIEELKTTSKYVASETNWIFHQQE
jgi:hypothetical protein